MKNCVKCQAPAHVMCSRCYDPYCGRKCQFQDWFDHKVVCKPMPKLVPINAFMDSNPQEESKLGKNGEDKPNNINAIETEGEGHRSLDQPSAAMLPLQKDMDCNSSLESIDGSEVTVVTSSKLGKNGEGKTKNKNVIETEGEGHRSPDQPSTTMLTLQKDMDCNSLLESIKASEGDPKAMVTPSKLGKNGEDKANIKKDIEELQVKKQPLKSDEEILSELMPCKPELAPCAKDKESIAKDSSKLSKILNPKLDRLRALRSSEGSTKRFYLKDIGFIPIRVGENIPLLVTDTSLMNELIVSAMDFENEARLALGGQMRKLAEYTKSAAETKTGFEPEKDELCLAIFDEDGEWYRSLVTATLPSEGLYQVQFIDFGNISTVTADKIMPIVEELMFPICTNMCIIKEEDDVPKLKQILERGNSVIKCNVSTIEMPDIYAIVLNDD